MNIRKTLLATVLGAVPFLACGAAPGAGPLMSTAAATPPPANAALTATMAAERTSLGLDANHNFVIGSQHPGVQGTTVTRVQHTYKGVRVFGSESVLVTDSAGKVISESSGNRRLYLGKGPANKLGGQPGIELNVQPQLSTTAAIEIAVKSVAPAGAHVVSPSAELVIYPMMKTERVPSATGKPEAELNALDTVAMNDWTTSSRCRTWSRPTSWPTWCTPAWRLATSRCSTTRW